MKFREVFVGKPIKVDNITVVCPEGYCIDEERSTKNCIKFKKIKEKENIKPFRNDKTRDIAGYYIMADSNINTHWGSNTSKNYNLFATLKQAKSALAMARISQIMANDERFGGIVTYKDWANTYIPKFIIINNTKDGLYCGVVHNVYNFLAFYTSEQRDLFLKENEDLVKDYLMVNNDN